MVDTKSRTSRRSLLEKLGILSVTCQYIYIYIYTNTLMNSTVYNQENFQKILLYTELTQEISTVFTSHLPNFHVFRNVHSILALNFQQFTTMSH
jgi:endonuclease III-like uncharacterized protein